MPGSGASHPGGPPRPADFALRAPVADARTPSSASRCGAGNSAATTVSRARRDASQRTSASPELRRAKPIPCPCLLTNHPVNEDLRTPGTTPSADPEVEKEAIRRSFAFARNAQLSQPSAVRFIRGLERRGVHTLFADGPELVARLRAHGPAGVRPELELVEPGARDAGTGLLLQDIWRYARHFWSIPYQSTPGRNMYYLVRDGAAGDRPLIGIAALGNTVLGLAQRDDYAGWSAEGMRTRLGQAERAGPPPACPTNP